MYKRQIVKSIRKHIRGRNVVANPPGSARSLFRKNFPTEIRRSSCLREAADFCPRAAINGLTHRNNAQNYSSTCIRKSRRLTILSTTSAPSSATKALTGIRQEKKYTNGIKRLPTAHCVRSKQPATQSEKRKMRCSTTS